jgi:Flp pilus assembly protein TadG
MKRIKQQGSQIVEFALVLPVMILVILLAVDAGIFAYDKAVITNASREFTRRGVVLSAASWTTSSSALKQSTCDYLKTALISFSTGTKTASCGGTADPLITITPTATPAFGTAVSVSISYPVKGIFWQTAHALVAGYNTGSSTLTLTASTSMAHE